MNQNDFSGCVLCGGSADRPLLMINSSQFLVRCPRVFLIVLFNLVANLPCVPIHPCESLLISHVVLNLDSVLDSGENGDKPKHIASAGVVVPMNVGKARRLAMGKRPKQEQPLVPLVRRKQRNRGMRRRRMVTRSVR
jgi:hypothetical protein